MAMGLFLPVSYGLAIIVTFVAIMAFLLWTAQKTDTAGRSKQPNDAEMERHIRETDEMERRIRETEREISELSHATRSALLREALRRSKYQGPERQ